MTNASAGDAITNAGNRLIECLSVLEAQGVTPFEAMIALGNVIVRLGHNHRVDAKLIAERIRAFSALDDEQKPTVRNPKLTRKQVADYEVDRCIKILRNKDPAEPSAFTPLEIAQALARGINSVADGGFVELGRLYEVCGRIINEATLFHMLAAETARELDRTPQVPVKGE